MKAKYIWLLVGYRSLGAGIADVVTPLLPTTPFLLLAAFAFARSSPRLESWLLAHPRLGPAIENWRRHAAIGRRAKNCSSIAIASAFGLSLLLGAGTKVLMILAVVLGGAALFVLSLPSGPRAARKDDWCA